MKRLKRDRVTRARERSPALEQAGQISRERLPPLPACTSSAGRPGRWQDVEIAIGEIEGILHSVA